jgi:predicted phosphodiesterase
MSQDLGERLFTYAVITDTHLNQGETECNSPFQVNKMANGRMRHVIHDLNTREVDFVLHLGDLLHPVPAIPHLYERAAKRFKEQVSQLRHKLYVVPGNHDIGDKPVEWGPAGVVREEFIALWREHFGPQWQSFSHKGCRFITMDSQILNTGLKAEKEQKKWLEAEMKAANKAGERIFFNSHFPPFLTYADEDEHYDNLAEPGRSWVLSLMKKHKVEALFAGHVHNFWYHQYHGTQCWLLPSTAFVRQDYSEMYRVSPAPHAEQGRNDAPKLGYFVVHVYKKGHLCEIVRTFGKVVKPNAKVIKPAPRIRSVHPIESPVTRFGFDMRQNWLEVIEIPPSGGLDEFDRKRTRNDYGLMALMEMGVRRIRIPGRDLMETDHRRRLNELKDLGFLFTLFTFGVPDAKLAKAIRGARGLIDCWEVAHRPNAMAELAKGCAPIAKAIGAELYLSKLRGKDAMEKGGEKYYHMINHGFVASETKEIAALKGLPGVTGAIFRVAGESSPARAARDAAKICKPLGLKVSLHVRMSLGNPGAVQADEVWVARRAAEALAASQADKSIMAYSDTFADVDRGYFTRLGVVDRRYNPRAGYFTIRYLTGAIVAAGKKAWALGGTDETVAVGKGWGKGSVVDLTTGEIKLGTAKSFSKKPVIWIGK